MDAGLTAEQTGRWTGIDSWLTTERVAYGAVALVAAGVRLGAIAAPTLAPAEAAQALPAWQAASGLPYDLAGTSPLLFTLQRLLFLPFGGSDAMARLWPALLGGLAVLCFYAFRGRLGNSVALVAALLWALSPMALFTGRLGLGYGLVPPLTLAFLAFLTLAFERSQETGAGPAPGHRERLFMALAAVALGLLLAAGSGAYTVLLAGAVGLAVWPGSFRAVGERLRGHWRPVALACVLALLVGATGLLAAPAGLAAAVDLLGDWVSGLALGAGVYGTWDILRRLLLSEPLLLGFAAGGLALAVRDRPAPDETGEGAPRTGSYRFQISIAAAGLVALLVSLLGSGRHPADLALVVIALSLLAGSAIVQTLRAILSWHGELDPWALLVLVLALLASAAVSLPSYFNAPTGEFRGLYFSVGLGSILLIVVLALVYGYWGSWRTVGQVLSVVALIAGSIWMLAQLTGINYDRYPLHRAAVLKEAPGSGWLDLENDLGRLSALHGGGERGAQIDVVLPGEDDPLAPMLRWALKNYPAAHFAGSVSSQPAPIVITPLDAQAPGENYMGANYVLLERWGPESLPDLTSRVRWLLYREARTPAETREIVLWTPRIGGAAAPADGDVQVEPLQSGLQPQ